MQGLSHTLLFLSAAASSDDCCASPCVPPAVLLHLLGWYHVLRHEYKQCRVCVTGHSLQLRAVMIALRGPVACQRDVPASHPAGHSQPLGVYQVC